MLQASYLSLLGQGTCLLPTKPIRLWTYLCIYSLSTLATSVDLWLVHRFSVLRLNLVAILTQNLALHVLMVCTLFTISYSTTKLACQYTKAMLADISKKIDLMFYGLA